METPQIPSPVPPPPPAPQPAVYRPPAPPRTSGMAIASLVLGIFGCCTCITGIAGLILGIIGLNQIKNSNGRLGGQGLAIAGIVMSGVSIVFFFILIMLSAILFPVFSKAREKARETQSVNQVKQIVLAVISYAQDNNETLPPMGSIEELRVTKIDSELWTSPVTGEPYSTNARLSGLSLGDPALVPKSGDVTTLALVYEGTSTHGSRVVGFLDGHVEPISDEQWPAIKAASGIP